MTIAALSGLVVSKSVLPNLHSLLLIAVSLLISATSSAARPRTGPRGWQVLDRRFKSVGMPGNGDSSVDRAIIEVSVLGYDDDHLEMVDSVAPKREGVVEQLSLVDEGDMSV
jgi:hypothetical protein